MVTLKETAMAYEPTQMRNIAELEAVPLNIEIKHETRKNKDGEEYDVKFIGMNGDHYRIPNSVLEGMKNILDTKPECQVVKVVKKGEGLNTRYQVVTLE